MIQAKGLCGLAVVAAMSMPSAGWAVDTPEEVLRAVYAPYLPGYQSKQPPKREQWLDATLQKLLREDARCHKGEVGALDGDPFVDAQDWDENGISPPKFRLMSKEPPVTWEASFQLFPKQAGDPLRRVLYVFRPTGKGWRISDIRYESGDTLKRLLAESCH